jgi:adhesin transport system outer membrane protein
MRQKIFQISPRVSPALVYLLALFSSYAAAADDKLFELVSEGLRSYPTILSRKVSRDAAETELKAAKLRFLPNPSLNTQRNQVAYSGQSISNQPATNVTVSQPIWMGGGLVAGYDKADARLSASDYALLEARDDVSKRIITSYAEWAKSYEKIMAYEENVRTHEKLVTLIRNRNDQGVASGADRDLAVSRLHQAQADLESARGAESTALTALSELVGHEVRRQDLLQKRAKHDQILRRADGIAKAQAINPTIHRFKFEADAAEAEAKEIRAQALPQVSLQAQRQIGNAYLPGAQGYDLYGLVVTYAPGGGFSTVASASAANERARAARINVEAAKRDLTDKLNAEYNEYEFALLKMENLRKAATLASDVSASYDRQYLVGRKNWLDLMNAVREKAQNKAQLADAEGSLLAASRRLQVFYEGTMPFDDLTASDRK